MDGDFVLSLILSLVAKYEDSSGLVETLLRSWYLQTMHDEDCLGCELGSLILLIQDMQRRWWQGILTRLEVMVSHPLHDRDFEDEYIICSLFSNKYIMESK